MNIKARSHVKQSHVRAVILLEFCNLNYAINNWTSCLFSFWNWKCIIITSPWASIAKDEVILIQLFCFWSSSLLVLLSPVRTGMSSAEYLALPLCVRTYKVGVCVTEPVSSCKILIRPPKISHHSWWNISSCQGEGKKKHLKSALLLPSTHSGSSPVTGPAAVPPQDSTWKPFPHTKKSHTFRRLPKMTSALERICNYVYKRM